MAIIFLLMPVILIIKLCKTKDHTAVSEFVFVIVEITSCAWLANFIRRWDPLAIMPHYVGK
jgi:uncharacterized protein with PQ loop repeat